MVSEDEETGDDKSKLDDGSNTKDGHNQDGELDGENFIDDLHEKKKMAEVESGLNVEMPDAFVVLKKLNRKETRHSI